MLMHEKSLKDTAVSFRLPLQTRRADGYMPTFSVLPRAAELGNHVFSIFIPKGRIMVA
jgi:hypothetical protein